LEFEWFDFNPGHSLELSAPVSAIAFSHALWFRPGIGGEMSVLAPKTSPWSPSVLSQQNYCFRSQLSKADILSAEFGEEEK